jgi:hypothetical protein
MKDKIKNHYERLVSDVGTDFTSTTVPVAFYDDDKKIFLFFSIFSPRDQLVLLFFKLTTGFFCDIPCRIVIEHTKF